VRAVILSRTCLRDLAGATLVRNLSSSTPQLLPSWRQPAAFAIAGIYDLVARLYPLLQAPSYRPLVFCRRPFCRRRPSRALLLLIVHDRSGIVLTVFLNSWRNPRMARRIWHRGLVRRDRYLTIPLQARAGGCNSCAKVRRHRRCLPAAAHFFFPVSTLMVKTLDHSCLRTSDRGFTPGGDRFSIASLAFDVGRSPRCSPARLLAVRCTCTIRARLVHASRASI